MVEEIGDKRLYINRERERGECACACVLFYNTKLWTQFYISGLSWEEGWLRSVCASSQYDQTLLFLHIIPKTHTGLQKIQKKKNTQQLHVAGHYSAEISLNKAISFSIQHLYCLKYKTHHFSNKT